MDNTEKRLTPEAILGVEVKIKTTLGEEFEGEIFSYDTTSNCVILIQSSHHSLLKRNYRVLKTSFIKEIQYLGKNENSSVSDLSALPSVNVQKIRAKEEAALRKIREDVSKIGVGVSKEAQEIFDALSKTLRCRWNRDIIVVFDEVQIKPPYDVDCCSGNDSFMLERVKKVLDGEKRRLQKS
jgi:ElaB/YqjD/DUF883 family membrane-anchored ribosome-binding protein